MGKTKRFTIYELSAVGVMAAIIFVLTYFVRIPIPTPAGETNLKIANTFCLLAGILFGGLRGGLAAGIGSMLFDLLNPLYITSAPTTLINFFLMAFICGIIVNQKGKPFTTPRIIAGSAVGAFSYVVLYICKSVISKTLDTTGFTSLIFSQTGAEAFQAAVVACVPKMITTTVNAVISIVLAAILAPILKKALQRVGFYQKTTIGQ